MRKLIVRSAVALVLLVALGGAGWVYFTRGETPQAPSTVAVERGTVEQTVLATGALEAQSVTSVGAQVSGTIQSLRVKLGDDVKKGDLIAQIDSTNQQNAVKSAEAALANLQAQLQAKQAELTGAQAALERAQKLSGQSLVSTADLMTAQSNLATAEAAIASLTAQISQGQLSVDDANLALQRTTIGAPVDGTVVAVLVTEGQSVNANQSSPTIVKIADLDNMIIKAQISEADITKVRPGQAATFTILGDPNTRIPASLSSIDPAPDAIATADDGLAASENAIYYNGLFTVANPDHHLRIAMTAQVTITIATASNVLVLPASVLGTAGGKGGYRLEVYDAATGQTREAQVKVGLNNNISAEIVSGLNEGDLVVTTRTQRSAGTSTSTNASSSNAASRATARLGGLLGGGAPPPGG